jgi:glycosyltransferase involved in cell wall biosynthesis
MSLTSLPLSIFIITLNEADRLGAVLEAVRGVSDDVVVIDSGSNDGTQELARSQGARLIENPWSGYGLQKRFAEDQCRHDWVLNLDADEVPTPSLIKEILELFKDGSPVCDAYAIRIVEVFPTESEPHPLAYGLSPVRLYRRSKGRYSSSTVHDRVELAAGTKTGHCKSIILHHSVRSLGDQITKLNRYTDAQALNLEARGITIPAWRVLFEFKLNFIKAYIGRRHFLRGIYGFLTAMNYAFARHLRLAKHIERQRMKEKGTREKSEKV